MKRERNKHKTKEKHSKIEKKGRKRDFKEINLQTKRENVKQRDSKEKEKRKMEKKNKKIKT